MTLTPQQWSVQLHQALESSKQRIVLECVGDFDWCQSFADVIRRDKHVIILSDNETYAHSIPFNKSIQLLGQETEVVIYDAFSGFHVDAFARAAGLIKSPGLLIICRPETKQWLQQPDVSNLWQDEKQGHNHFLKYFLDALQDDSAVIRCEQHHSLPDIHNFIFSEPTRINSSTRLASQQQMVWDSLQATVNSDKHSSVILASRGRGKSTLLGLWLNQADFKSKRFIVTSDSKKAAGACLGYVRDAKNISYVALDELLEQDYAADWVIVDEAATLPIALLFKLKVGYKKVIYTSTVDGYEGTGSGFEQQFLASFDANECQRLVLEDPMRWGKKDLLEAWLNDTLLLNRAQPLPAYEAEVIFKQLSQQQLLNNRVLLIQIFQLLKTAHYRTKASDLRMLLDNPDITVFVALKNKTIVGVLLLSFEGGLDDALCREIYFGRRRPQGHLLAQGLTAHAGCENFAQLKGVRIQRIAVNEAYRNNGIGSSLIAAAIEFSVKNEMDYLGASFSLDIKRINFWFKNKLSLMYVSVGQGTSTGQPSVFMLLALGAKAQTKADWMQDQLAQGFLDRLLSHFNDMPVSQVSALMPLLNIKAEPNLDNCVAYIEGFKGFKHALPSLRKLVFNQWRQADNKINNVDKALLIKAILQYQPWKLLIQEYELNGQKQLNQNIKMALKKLMT